MEIYLFNLEITKTFFTNPALPEKAIYFSELKIPWRQKV